MLRATRGVPVTQTQSLVSRLLAWLLPLCCLAALTAQKQEAVEIRYPIPERFERATKTDDKGLEQWAPWDQPKCTTCAGKGKTKCATCERFHDDAKHCVECKRNKDRETGCRTCGGLGYWPDPLEKVTCPQCMGAAVTVCHTCAGGGQIKITGGGDRWTNCPACRGDGGWKCATCNGARVVETATLKPSLKEANSQTLAKAIAATDKVLAAVTAFTPTAKDSRKEVKEFGRIVGEAGPLFPPMKRIGKALEDVMGKVYGGNQFQGHEEAEANTVGSFKAHTEYYLKHQKRMMELAQKRAETNEKVLAESKAK
jgi:hypothetical protein